MKKSTELNVHLHRGYGRPADFMHHELLCAQASYSSLYYSNWYNLAYDRLITTQINERENWQDSHRDGDIFGITDSIALSSSLGGGVVSFKYSCWGLSQIRRE